MSAAKSHIPSNLRAITPTMTVKNALEAIEFYKKVFGAELIDHAPGPAPGSTMHAAIRIADAVIFLGDEMPGTNVKAPASTGAPTGSLMLYVANCDEVIQRAVTYGAKKTMAAADQFWGDRYGQIIDPFGHVWGIATHKEDLSPAEMAERTRAFLAQMETGACPD